MAEYSGAVPNFLSKAFERIDSALSSFAQSFSSSIATEIAPLVAGGLTLTFIMMGLMAVYGMLDRPFKELAWRMLWASVIMSIALTSAMYQSYIIDSLLTLPDELVASLMNGAINDGNVVTGQNATGAIEELFSLGTYNAGQYFNEANIGITEFNIAPYIYGSLVFIGTLLCVLVGTIWLFVAKVVLALMLGVGPIFIVCLIWKPTQQFFWSWVGQILNTILTTIFVLAVFSIFASFFKDNLTALQISKESEGFIDSATFAFIGILCMAVLITIPQYVSQLTGGAGGAVGSAMGRITGGGVGAMLGGMAGATAGVAGTSRAGFAGKSAVDKYKQARGGGQGKFASARGARHEFNKSRQEMKQGYPDYYRQQPSNRRNPEKK